MKILVDSITEDRRELTFAEGAEDLNARFRQGTHDWEADTALDVDLSHYRAGDDLVFTGRIRGRLRGTCARCAEDFLCPLDAPFDLVLTPRLPQAAEDGALSADDVALGFYEGEEVDLGPLVCEQTLLALPTRPLCREDCRGLCPQCGANLNSNPCTCVTATSAPRLGALRTLLREK